MKRPWCWEGLGAGGEGDNRRWDGWMASPTQRTWVCVNSGSWWWTGRSGVLQSMWLQRVGHDWANEQNWTEWYSLELHGGSVGKESAHNLGDLDSIPGLGRSPGEGNRKPIQHSGLENSMDCVVMELQRVRRDCAVKAHLWFQRTRLYSLSWVKPCWSFYSYW